ncbi:MAG: hypothetical protein STSR0008_12000 [Ignavibacterium sp.]
MYEISFDVLINFVPISSEINLISIAIINCVRNSQDEPFAICKKEINSLFDSRSNPSAIFDGIDNEVRHI